MAPVPTSATISGQTRLRGGGADDRVVDPKSAKILATSRKKHENPRTAVRALFLGPRAFPLSALLEAA